MCGADVQEGDLWYFVAPKKYLGNAASVYGKRLIFDLKQTTAINQIRAFDVELNGSGLIAVKVLRANPRTSWTPNTVDLSELGGWQIQTGSTQFSPATEAELRQVFSNFNSLRIRGEFVDGPNDEACLDNVYFGTP